MKREEAIARKIHSILSSISANPLSTQFDGKYLFQSSLSPQENSIEFNIKYPKSYRSGYMEIIDFEINISCKKEDNLQSIEEGKNDIMQALIEGIDELRSIFGNVLKWLDFEFEPTIQVEGEAEIAEAQLSISLLHRVSEKLVVDLTDYSGMNFDVITNPFLTSGVETFYVQKD